MKMHAVILVALALAASLAFTAAAAEPTRLGRAQAAYATQETLDAHLNDAWTYRADGEMNCKRRVTFSVRICRFGWAIGDAYYFGRSRVSMVGRRDGVRVARVRYGVRFINGYCVEVHGMPPSECDRYKQGFRRVFFR